jgi:hypothetical protein
MAKLEQSVNARVWENIRKKMITELQSRGITFETRLHDIKRDSGYYMFDKKDKDGNPIYTIMMPDGQELSDNQNPFDERDLFSFVYSLFHEYKHILQREDSVYHIQQVNEENMSFGMAGMISEYFVEYDEANYANDPRELDAQIYGIEQAVKYIQKNYPWVDVEKCCLGFVKNFIDVQKKSGFPELSFSEKASGSIGEILADLRNRMENPTRAKLSDIELNDYYDEGSPEKMLRDKVTDEFKKKYDECQSIMEKDQMLVDIILEVYPEATQEYPIVKMKSKGEKGKMDVHEKISDLKLDISDSEKKIEQLKKEIQELKKQGNSTYIQVLTKKLQISELEIDIIDSQGAADRMAKGEVLKDLKEKKDGKQFLEHKYLSDCYRNNNELQRRLALDAKLNINLKMMIANKQVGTKEYQELQAEIKSNNEAILMAQSTLDKSIQLYAKQGGKQGTNIDFSVPYTYILEQYERDSKNTDLVKRPYDIQQLADDMSTKSVELNDIQTALSQIRKETTAIFSNGLNGTSKELAEIYGEMFTHYSVYGNTMFEDSSRMAEMALGTSMPEMPEEIIKRDDNKYIIVYTDEKGKYVGIPCSRNQENGELEVIGGDGVVINNEQLSRMRETTADKDKITYDQMEMQVVRYNIERSIQDGKVTEIVEVTDPKLVHYLNQQNGLNKYSARDDSSKVYMISRQDEDGNTHYEFVAHNGLQGYTKLEGLQQVPNKQKSIIIDGSRIPGQPTPMQRVDCAFIDNDGNSYFAYHQFGQGEMVLSYSEHGKENAYKIEVSKDSGLNRMLHNSRVRSLMRAGYNAMGIGYEKVKTVYSKFKGKDKENEVENTRED